MREQTCDRRWRVPLLENVAAVAKVRAGSIAEMIPPECAVASEFAAAANARLGIAGAETERMG